MPTYSNYHDMSFQLVPGNYTDMIFGVRLGAHTDMYFGDCPVLLAYHNMYFGSNPVVSNYHDMYFGDCRVVSNFTDMGFSLFGDYSNFCDMSFGIAANSHVNYADMLLSLLDGNPVSNYHDMIWSDVGQDALLQLMSLSVTIAGTTVNPHYIDLEWDDQEIGPTVELHLAAEDEAVLAVYQAAIVITVNSESVPLYCERGFTEAKDQAGKTEYTVKGQCRVAQALTDELLTEEFDSALASTIITDLAGRYGISVDYRALDWLVPANSLYLNDETALDGIRQLKEVIGAILEDVDGVLVVRPYHETSSWECATATPDIYLTEQADFLTQRSEIEERPGYNSYYISDQLTPEDEYRLESEDVDDETVKLKAFQVPWAGDIGDDDLSHSGGSWVVVEPMGVTEEQIEEEQVEIVDGAGSTQYPIYSIDEIDYQETNLGAITFGEDGTLETATEGNSLVALTYTTKYRLWEATSTKDDDVQFILVGEEA